MAMLDIHPSYALKSALAAPKGFTLPAALNPVAWVRAAAKRAEQKRTLARMSPHIMRDIGLTPSDIRFLEIEGHKSANLIR